MKLLINKVQGLFRKILGVQNPKNVIYKTDFPDGRLYGLPTQMGAFSLIDYGGTVKIGKNVKIGYGVLIFSVSSIIGSKNEKIIRKPVIIGNDVEIGSNTTIHPGVTIGDNATIGAGAVVISDVPPNSIAVGVPAKVVKWKNKK